nr:MAG TPA: hypothetical protein [Caudoviricetes sp.]
MSCLRKRTFYVLKKHKRFFFNEFQNILSFMPDLR